MYRLLTTEWGVDDYFAATLIDHYGGHIWDVYQALKRLSRDKKYFCAFDSNLSSKVINCLNWKGNQDGDREKMVQALRQLAVTGFYPIQDYCECDQCQ